MKNKAKLLDVMTVKKRLKTPSNNKDKNKWLFLPIETKVRELDAKLLLTYYAVQENYKVLLGLSGLVEEALEFLPKGIFLDKGYKSKDKVRRFQTAKDNGHIVVNLEEEGFPLTEKDAYLDKFIDKKSLNILDYEFCWGEVQKNTILNAYPFVKEKCFITGNPRFDLLNKKYRVLFNENVAKIKHKYGNFILVNTRFPLYTKTVKDDGLIDHKIFERLGRVYGEAEQNKMYLEYKNFIKMIKEISKKYPNINIVVRPHPSDKFNVYERDLRGHNNVFVVHDGNVVNWILSSQLVIHSGCTTGVESFLLEKPVVSYISTKEDKYDLPNELSIKIYNLKDLFHFIDQDIGNYVFSNNKFNEYNKATLLSKYALDNGKFAYENIMKQLNKILINNSLTNNEIQLHQELLYKLNVEANKKVYHENTIVRQKFPDLQSVEIQNFFNKLDKIENKKTNISIHQLHDKLFEIVLE